MTNIINYLKQVFSKPTEVDVAPEGFCPNCWGRQEYGGEFRNALAYEKIDLNNINQKTGWINAYAKKNFEGIKLRESPQGMYCPSCKTS